MKLPLMLLVLGLCSTAAADDDEAAIERLIRTPAVSAKPAPVRGARHAAKTTLDAALIGQRVRVDTVDNGLYFGTLQSANAELVTLLIELPTQALNYSMPRNAIAALQPIDEAAP